MPADQMKEQIRKEIQEARHYLSRHEVARQADIVRLLDIVEKLVKLIEEGGKDE